MSQIEELQFRHAVARRYADLAGVEHDLTLVEWACVAFASRPAVGSHDAIVSSRAIGTYAAVTYCRTLSTGVRSGIAAEMIKDLPEDLQRVHEDVKAMRDKFLTHSVNFDEENVVNVDVEVQANGQFTLSALGNHSLSNCDLHA